jgi:uncharacterized protein (DUF849 family)
MREFSLRPEEKVLRKVIITAAVTGQGPTPTMSEYLPLTPKQIADDAVGAYEAGASIVHVHARKPDTGEGTPNPEIFRQIITDIKKRCSVVINITTGGAGTPEERGKVIEVFRPELATLNCGTLSIPPAGIYDKIKDKIKYEWEHEHMSNENTIFVNTYGMMREYNAMARAAGTKPEVEIWDSGQINAVKYMIDRKWIDTPVHLQFVMGALSGMPATIATLDYMYNRAREVIGHFTWSVAAVGKDQISLGAATLCLGGHVRVGLEDSLFAGLGRQARSSAEQVERIVNIAKEMSILPASPVEARQMLGLKGLDKVNY